MFDFDEVVDRKGTNCAKWDTIEANNKPKDVLPMWVADMDFPSPPAVAQALAKVAAQGTPYSKSEVYKQLLALQAD